MLLSVCTILGLADPAGAQTGGWLQSDQTGRLDKSELEQIYVVNTRALNFRDEPSVDNTPLRSLAKGAYLKKTDETINSVERRTWYHVVWRTGEEGWVASEYLAPVSDALWTVDGALRFAERLGSPAVASATRPALDEIRAGFLYVGPIGDAGWTYAHEKGRQAMAKLPYVKAATYVESVPGDPDLVLEAIDKLVADGHNVIFTTSFDHMDPTIEAARRYPDVVFMNCSGYKTEPNAGTYFGRMYQVRYLTGLLAGIMTQTNELGYVAALPTPDVVHGINAFALGARSVNKDVDVRVAWTNTWYGPDIESEKAEALLDEGADVLAMEQDSPAVIQAAAKRGKYAIGYQSDMSLFAPELTLTSAVYEWAPIYISIAEQLHEGTWQSENIWWGLKEGAVGLAPMAAAVPQAVRDLVESEKAQIIEGSVRVFEGPIQDAAGQIRVPARQVMSDADLLSMDYFVRGVTGEMPALPDTPSDAATN
ncbi:MAG: BMP family ABC transporter substrate-binding protein [Alphaproteobacteria bacterium]